MKLGSLIFYKNIPTFGSWLQRKILGTPYSHLSIYIGTNELGRMEEFEANAQVDTTTLTLNKNYREVYEIDAPYETMKECLNAVINRFEEDTYGPQQWLSILIRRIGELLGFERAREWNILWDWGKTCTELIWYFLSDLSGRLNRADIRTELSRYNPDTFHPGDVKYFVDKYGLFNKLEI